MTPLHNAAAFGHLKVCIAIMNEIQDKNPSDNRGLTPLHYAAERGHLEVCKAIMNEVQDKNLRLPGESSLTQESPQRILQRSFQELLYS